MISDLSSTGAPTIADFFNNNFTNVTEIRHGNFANFSNAASQDALNGTGAFAGSGAADIFVIGRSISSGEYDVGDADGYNNIAIPFVNFTSYTARAAGNRLGWHTGSTTTGQLVAGAESTLTPTGAAILGVPAGTYDFLQNGSLPDTNADTFNGLAAGTTGFGGGQILATVGPDTLAAWWPAGSAPGDPTSAGVATFPADRLLLNLDNDPNASNNGLNDFNNLTADGLAAVIGAVAAATPLEVIPEPSTGILGLLGLGLALRRRR